VFLVSSAGVVTACSFKCLAAYLESLDLEQSALYQFGQSEPLDAFLDDVDLLSRLGYRGEGRGDEV